MPRILHVIGSLEGGGAETQLRILLRGLADKGWSVGVLFFYGDVSRMNRDDITCYQINRGLKCDLVGVYQGVRASLDDFSPDLVHTWMPEIITLPAIFLARRRGIPVVNSQRRSLRHRLSLVGRMRDLWIPVCHFLSTKVVTNFSFDLEPSFVRRLILLREGEVVRNALSINTICRSRNQWIRDDAFKIVFVGRLVEQKRVDLLIRAISSLRSQGVDVQLAVYGQGSLFEELKCLTHTLGLERSSVRFEGYDSAWHSYAWQYDLLVLPTLAEGMPNVLVEAMASGLPILSTNIFEIRQLVTHGKNGWLVAPGDLSELIKGLRHLIKEPALLRELHFGGLDLAASHGVDDMVCSYIKIYEQNIHVEKLR